MLSRSARQAAYDAELKELSDKRAALVKLQNEEARLADEYKGHVQVLMEATTEKEVVAAWRKIQELRKRAPKVREQIAELRQHFTTSGPGALPIRDL